MNVPSNKAGVSRRMNIKEETRQAYNAIAEKWHEGRVRGESFYNEFLDMPNTLAVLGNIRGRSILDVGCGTGLYAKALVGRGARVYGIDISEKEIEIAKAECRGADFRVGSASDMPYANSKFDIVLMALAFTYFENMDAALDEARRVLKPHGRLVVSAANPVVGATIRIKGRPRTYRRFYDYFEESVTHRRWTVKRMHVAMPVKHITMETLLQLFIRHGFVLRRYRDARPLKNKRSSDKARYNFTKKVPYFMVMDLVRLSEGERRRLLK